MTATAGPLEGALAALLADLWGDPGAGLDGLRRLSGGASRETWSLDGVRTTGERVPLILQRDRPAAVRTGGGMATEAALLRAAAAAGVPVASVLADGGADGGSLGAPFLLLERLEGETIPRKLLRDEEFADVRPRLAAQCGRALAAIHRIPASAAPALQRDDQLAFFRTVLDTLGEPHPAFELGFRWLDSNRPPVSGETVVHGDFRNGNLVVGAEGIRAVLDWELAHVGDPMEDLGWLCVKAWRFGSPLPVGGFGSYEELFGAYEEAGGVAVDPAVVRWWEALGTLKWGVMCIMQANSHLTGMSRSVELAAIGRRVCENEHDLLGLLPGPDRPGSSPAGGDDGSHSPHDRPTAGELVEAVREYLEHDVMATTEGRVQFHARVAVNVLGMVERELRDGPAQAAAHAARLAALGVGDDAELAASIRAGAFDDRYDEVKALVWESVLDKLRVANPKYLNDPA